jgi:CRISPR locus-related DNA-binding protein
MTGVKTLYVFTFGWSPEFVIRPLLEEGVLSDATIVLLASKPETDYVARRVEEAVKQVRSFLELAHISNLNYVEVDVNTEFLEICRSILRALKEFTDASQIKFYLTGGMRVLVIATLVVARLLGAVHGRVEIRLSREDRPAAYDIPLSVLDTSPRSLTKTQVEVLKQLKMLGEVRFDDLAFTRSPVTVRKHLTKLREMGLVTYTARGRKQFYRLTPLGELILEALG